MNVRQRRSLSQNRRWLTTSRIPALPVLVLAYIVLAVALQVGYSNVVVGASEAEASSVESSSADASSVEGPSVVEASSADESSVDASSVDSSSAAAIVASAEAPVSEISSESASASAATIPTEPDIQVDPDPATTTTVVDSTTSTAAISTTTDSTTADTTTTATVTEETNKVTSKDKGEDKETDEACSAVQHQQQQQLRELQQQLDQQCQVFLAESTIPNAGLGVYTATAKLPTDTVGYPQLCIPMPEMTIFNRRYPTMTVRNYKWDGLAVGLAFETPFGSKIEGFCTGIYCAANAHTGLVNVERPDPIFVDDGSLHRTKDPGVGAFTRYSQAPVLVSRVIPPGGELFLDYGDEWFQIRQEAFPDVPLQADYKKALELLENEIFPQLVQQLKQMKQDATSPTTAAVASDTIADHSASISELDKNLMYQMVLEQGQYSTGLRNAFPNTLKEALKAVEAHDMGVVIQPSVTRSLEWLRKNGRCTDHIRPAPSTLPQAGYGAFATRNLPAGSIVATSPLLHVPDRVVMNMYRLPTEPDWLAELTENIHLYVLPYHFWHQNFNYPPLKGYQLLLNYCFGHAASSLLLCPYGFGVSFINHARPPQANVRVQWAKDFTILHNHTIVEQGTIADFHAREYPMLALEYVALRDIAADEELFLDYGDAWHQAWQQHVLTYEPTGASDYASASYMNQHEEQIRTKREQKLSPYPENVHLRCHFGLVAPTEEEEKIPLEQRQYKWLPGDPGEYCYILARHEVLVNKSSSSTEDGTTTAHVTYLYTVEIGVKDDEVHWVKKHNVPRSAIRFFDDPCTTDMHLPAAFRHEIHLPDDMFPPQWRNKDHMEIPAGLRLVGYLVILFAFFYFVFSWLFE